MRNYYLQQLSLYDLQEKISTGISGLRETNIGITVNGVPLHCEQFADMLEAFDERIRRIEELSHHLVDVNIRLSTIENHDIFKRYTNAESLK